MFQLIKVRLSKDIFNELNESFPQEERFIENEFSVNLPAQYKLKQRIKRSWINNKPSPESVANYEKNFGPQYYSFTHGNFFGIVINSSLYFDSTLAPELAAKQDTWLHETLERADKLKYTNIVLFEHIPWFINEPNEKNGYFNIPATTRKNHIELLKKYGIQYVFAGHLHKNALGHDGDLLIVTTGPVGKPLGKDSSGLRVVTVKGNKISYPYYSLDSIPEKVRLNK